VKLPVATRIMVIPSNLNSNFSFKIIGDKIALNIIVKHEVEEINIIFPNPSAKAFKI